ncbi:MAG TPA: DUF433 domain-containing protein [Solirubrobacterales bacterium]|jgi:uncharacterized protein (DUF433 family)|nr:DUF433 domain-containing protein [Solirubrobacterales bacterium]
MLAGVSLRSVDKAIEEKVVKPKRSAREGTLLDRGDVLAIGLIAKAGLPLRPQTKRRINQWVREFLPEESFDEVRELPLSEILVLRSDAAFRQRAERLRRYLEGRERHIDRNPEVQGGEPVITGTRLPVRAVAERLNRGESISDLAEDYPGTPRDAFEAARIYAEAHPRRGRPARPWRDA